MNSIQTGTSAVKMKQRGFTIIELMITVAIVAILSAIALPMYQRAGAKTDRSIAIADINKIAQALERYYTYNRVYSNDFFTLSMASAAGVYQITDDPNATKYNYTIGVPSTMAVSAGTPAAVSTGQSFVIYAKPITGKNRDTWTLSQDNIGVQQRYAHGSTTPEDSWNF